MTQRGPQSPPPDSSLDELSEGGGAPRDPRDTLVDSTPRGATAQPTEVAGAIDGSPSAGGEPAQQVEGSAGGQAPTGKTPTGSAEDEATTLWARQDLFSKADLDIDDEEPLFERPPACAAMQLGGEIEHGSHGAAAPDPTTQTGPVSLVDLEAMEQTGAGASGGEADTVEMSSDQAAVAMEQARRAAEGYRPNSSVHIAGEEGVAARRLVEDEPPPPAPEAHEPWPRATMEKRTYSCRMCGKKVFPPRPRRFRGRSDSDVGFGCDTCENIFCAAHAIRVSGLVESIMHTGRFRCQLCALEKSKGS